MFTASHLKQLNETLQLSKSNKFRGPSGELMCKAACHFIENCSVAKLPIHDDDSVLENWVQFLDVCMDNKNTDVQKASIAAYLAYLSTYLYNNDGSLKIEHRESLYNKFVSYISNGGEQKQSACFEIFSKALVDFYEGHVAEVFGLVASGCAISAKTKIWSVSRGSALKALVNIPINLGHKHCELSTSMLESIYPILRNSLNDYTVDSRGDIGSHVREVGMECIESYLSFLANNDLNHIITPEIIKDLIIGVAQQAVEKIDRTRGVAGRVFFAILDHEPPIPHIPDLEKLKEIFPKTVCDGIDWACANTTFSLFVQLLNLPAFRYHVILGLVVSVGGLTEITVRCSTEALSKLLLDHENDEAFVSDLFTIMKQIFHRFSQEDRPVLLELVELTWKEIRLTRAINRIKAAIDVLGAMLQFEGSVQKRSLSILVLCLGHRFPIIRKASATKLYECMMIYRLSEQENLDMVTTLLTETIWESDLEIIRPVLEQISNLMCIPSDSNVTSNSTNSSVHKP